VERAKRVLRMMYCGTLVDLDSGLGVVPA